MLRTLLIWCFTCWAFTSAFAQSGRDSTALPAAERPVVAGMAPGDMAVLSDSFYIRSIQIECHRKTIDRIILREIAFKSGDKISKKNINSILEKESSKVFNTNLFVVADVLYYPVSRDTIDLVVSVVEKWYTYPVPIIDLADRNFSEWWKQRGRDLDRLIYGVRFIQQNFRGRNEDLRLLLQLGFIRMIEFEYRVPYIDRKQTIGMNMSVLFSNNKNLAYNTINNKREFVKSDDVLQDRLIAEVAFTKRSEFYNRHSFIIRYNQNHVADTIVKLNPGYFLHGGNRQRFFEIGYAFNRDTRNHAAYPLKGMLMQVKAFQKGLGSFDDLNQFEIRALYARFFQLNKALYFSTSLRGMVSFPERQPYSEMRAFGYSQNFARGYDLYVIDGQRFGLVKNTLRWQMLSVTKNLSKFIQMEQFSTFPLALYLKTYYDFGYVSNSLDARNRTMTNKLLWGGGVGLDVVLYNSMVLRFEYSFNKEKEHGFFFNLKNDF